jgi:hypothetical protein
MPTFSDCTPDLMGLPTLAVCALAGSGRAEAPCWHSFFLLVFWKTQCRTFIQAALRGSDPADGGRLLRDTLPIQATSASVGSANRQDCFQNEDLKHALMHTGQPARFNEIKRYLDGITHRSLTDALKRLERHCLVTPLSHSLCNPFEALCSWALADEGAQEEAAIAYNVSRASQVTCIHPVRTATTSGVFHEL